MIESIIEDLQPKKFKNKKLNTLLNQMTLKQLNWSKHDFRLIGTSKLKKQALIDRIIAVYRVTLPRFFNYLSASQLNILLECAKHGGIAQYKFQKVSEIRILKSLGLLFPVTKEETVYLVIPDILSDWLNQVDIDKLKNKANQTDSIKQYLMGVVNLYGLHSIRDFIDLYQLHNQVELDKNEFYDLISFYQTYEGYFEILGNLYIYHHMISDQLFDFVDEIKKRTNIKYYPFNKQHILKASHEYYVKKTSEYEKIVQYFTKRLKSKHDVTELCCMLYFQAISGQQMQGVINLISQYYEFKSLDDVNELIPLYMELCNNSHQWLVKGHCPSKLHKPIIPTSVQSHQVGRNNPCPCGSGKKYKKCCL